MQSYIQTTTSSSSSSPSSSNPNPHHQPQPQPQSPTKQQQQQQQQQEKEQSRSSSTSSTTNTTLNKKIRRAWNNFEVRLIKSADASKVDLRRLKSQSHSQSHSQSQLPNHNYNSDPNSVEARTADVKAKCTELLHHRKELRALLNEAEANIKDNVKELKALNLLFVSSGNCMSLGRGKGKGRGQNGGLKRRRVDDGTSKSESIGIHTGSGTNI